MVYHDYAGKKERPRKAAAVSRAVEAPRAENGAFPREEGRESDRREAVCVAKRRKEEFDAAAAVRLPSAEIAKFLDDRELLFAKEYLKDMNGTQAAIRAGYKPGRNNASAAVQASRLMRDERIRAYRAALIRESVEDMDVSRDSVVLKLMEIYRRCMSAEPVLMWDGEKGEWVNSGEWRFDARGAAKALEQLTKLLGLDAPQRHQLDGGGIEEILSKLGGGRSY